MNFSRSLTASFWTRQNNDTTTPPLLPPPLKRRGGENRTNGQARFYLGFTALLFLVTPLFAEKPRYVAFETASGVTREVVSNQLLVGYKRGRMAKARGFVRQAAQKTFDSGLQNLDIDLIEIPAGETLEGVMQKLKNNPDIEFVEPNGRLHAVLVPNDPQVSDQWQWTNIDQYAAWSITTGTSSVVVAVIDSGVDYTHPDLAANMWENPAAPGTYGFDCSDTNATCSSTDPMDDNGHGTMVSGMVSAVTNNGVGVAGAAWFAKLMAIKVLDSAGSGDEANAAAGIDKARLNGAKVINMSFGGPDTSLSMQRAIQRALDADIICIAASGNVSGSPATASCVNNRSVAFPANMAGVIAVGATDSANLVASFSCTGNSLDLTAPGVSVYSTALGGTYAYESGTSFSAPIVSGVAALMLSLDGELTPSEAAQYLTSCTIDEGSPGFDTSYGFGLLNTQRTLAALQTHTLCTQNAASPTETYPYPNPFYPATTPKITIALPTDMGTSNLEIKIFTTAGVQIITLSEPEWNGRNESGDVVASGLYYYTVKTDNGSTKGKITVLR